MKIYTKILFLITFILLSASYSVAMEYPFPRIEYKPSTCTYDFKNLSKQITAGAVTKYEKAKKIHEWVSRSFIYDDMKNIRTADQAMKHHKGVCQAICEVFYHLAKAQGIETKIINGMSHNITYIGHTWIMFTDDHKKKILADPTNAMVNRENISTLLYFDIDPRICILNHYPSFPEDQLLQMPLTFEDYWEIQTHPSTASNFGLFLFGINEKVLEKISQRQYEFPYFSVAPNYGITFKDIPLERELEVGKEYRITASIKNKNATLCALLDNGNVKHSVKTFQNGVTEIRFTPLCSEPVLICYEEDNMYKQIVKYDIKAPTMEQIAEIEKTDPYYSECLSSKSNIDTTAMKNHGISAERLLELCKQGKLGKEMPTFWENDKPEYTIKSIPMTNTLKKGNPYTFHVVVSPNKEMYLRDTNGKEYKNWVILPDGSQSITISPNTKGTLYVMQKVNSKQITSVIAYKVE